MSDNSESSLNPPARKKQMTLLDFVKLPQQILDVPKMDNISKNCSDPKCVSTSIDTKYVVPKNDIGMAVGRSLTSEDRVIFENSCFENILKYHQTG